MSVVITAEYKSFLIEIKERIYNAQYDALKAVNKELINLYWDIGRLIVAKQDALGWGRAIVETLAKDLQKEFPGMQGFSVQNLWNMRQFYLAYKDNLKLQPMVGEISWTKNVIIMQRCKDDIQREFYIKTTKKFGWTKDVLINQLEAGAFERYMTNQTNFDKAVPRKYRYQAKLAVKDEYSFDFLELGEEHSEKELERALLENVRKFLIAKLPDENPSIGIILCKDKSRTIVEYALKDTKKPIGVSTYKMTEKLPRELKKYLPSPEEMIERIKSLQQQ